MSLSPKRRAFIEHYLVCWNAAEAARRAGYSPRSAKQLGHRFLQEPEIRAFVEQRIAEKAMSADEVLLRLGEQARSEQAAYLRRDGSVDLERLLADGKGHLVKGIRWDMHDNMVVEFHDAQAALVQIGRHHTLFTDRTEEDVNLKVTGARDELERRIDQLIACGDAASVPAELE